MNTNIKIYNFKYSYEKKYGYEKISIVFEYNYKLFWIVFKYEYKKNIILSIVMKKKYK